MSDAVSDRLIAELEAEAKLVDQGEFTVDDGAARTKLAQHRMAEPADWVCLIVEAANLFGATRVDVLGQVSQLWIRFDGEPVDGDMVFSSAATEGADEPNHRLGLRKLAIAISTLFGHHGVPAVEIESRLGRVRILPDAPNEVSAGSERGNLVRVLGLPESERERARLRERCRHSPMAIDLEHERISFGMRQWLVGEGAGGITAIVDGERTIGHIGWKPDSSPATITFMTHGVAAERVTATTWEGLAIIDVPLRKDVGERAVLRDAEFDRVMALVEAAASRVPHEAPPARLEVRTPALPAEPEPEASMLVPFVLVGVLMVVVPILLRCG